MAAATIQQPDYANGLANTAPAGVQDHPEGPEIRRQVSLPRATPYNQHWICPSSGVFIKACAH
jgi:hypothetical protein